MGFIGFASRPEFQMVWMPISTIACIGAGRIVLLRNMRQELAIQLGVLSQKLGRARGIAGHRHYPS